MNDIYLGGIVNHRTCARVRISNFSTGPLVSLTPCFSWVLPADPVGVNRFQRFRGHGLLDMRQLQIRIGALKPLKRLTVAPSLLNTQLKQGVNEMGRGRKNLRCALRGVGCREGV